VAGYTADVMAFSILRRRIAALVCALLATTPLAAQDFGPRLYVNDRVITEYEVGQRVTFLKALRAPGDLEEEALKGLIEDRLKQSEAERLELSVTPEDVKQGMEEFAARANLTGDAFIAELAKNDIAAETFRDFVTSGLLWRQVVRARFIGQVPISENDVDDALEAATRPDALRVLVSELVIPVPEGEDGAEQIALANELYGSIRGEAAFAEAAQKYSAASTASGGGKLDWMPLTNLPGPIAGSVLALGPGEVSEPLMVPGAVILIQLRDLAEDRSAPPAKVEVEWAELLLPDDPAEIARVRAAADTCTDLYGLVKGQPADRLTVTKALAGAVPGDVGMEIARLDPGESSVALTRGGFRRFLMLCSRRVVADEPINRDSIREQVINQKLDGMAEAYLEELRASAIIREP
jgi:peptidyl-prolyl cis-trans isomerase SurA